MLDEYYMMRSLGIEPTPIPHTIHKPQRNGCATTRTISRFTVNGLLGVNINLALAGRVHDMDHKGDPFFEGNKDKVGVRLELTGYRPFTRQKYARRTKKGLRVNVTRVQVSKYIAEVVRDFIQEAADMKFREGQLRFGPGGLELKDLYLLELHQIGATVQPILGYYPTELVAATAQRIHQPAPAGIASPGMVWGSSGSNVGDVHVQGDFGTAQWFSSYDDTIFCTTAPLLATPDWLDIRDHIFSS